MRCLAVGDLVAHPRPQHEGASVAKLSEQFTLQAIHDVPLGTPVIGDVARRVLDDSDSKLATVKRPPDGRATLATVFRTGNIGPVGHLERHIRQFHSPASYESFPVRPLNGPPGLYAIAPVVSRSTRVTCRAWLSEATPRSVLNAGPARAVTLVGLRRSHPSVDSTAGQEPDR